MYLQNLSESLDNFIMKPKYQIFSGTDDKVGHSGLLGVPKANEKTGPYLSWAGISETQLSTNSAASVGRSDQWLGPAGGPSSGMQTPVVNHWGEGEQEAWRGQGIKNPTVKIPFPWKTVTTTKVCQALFEVLYIY